MVALGIPKGPKAPQSQMLVTFWAPFGSPRGALLGSFWPTNSKSEGLRRLFGALFPVSEKGAKTELPRGGGHAIRSRRRMFREGRPLSCWLHFGLHFGAILGAKVGTILLFGRPGRQQAPQIDVFFKCVFFVDFRVRQGGQEGNSEGAGKPPPPLSPLPRQSHPGAPPSA